MRPYLSMAVLLFGALGVSAAEPVERVEDEAPAELDPISVTANKRDQVLSEVAGSLTVLGAGELEDRHILDFGDYLNQVPGVSFQQQTPGVSNITVRGISVGEFFITYGAAVYFDEAPITSSLLLGFFTSSIDLRLVDIDRVEVLRGSQGTLYGANSISGVVRVISNAPDPALSESRVSAGLSTVADGAIGNELTGMVNIPVMDGDAAFRIVGYHFDDAGFIDNVTTGVNDVAGADVNGLRIGFGWEPSPELTMRAQFITQSQGSIGYPWVISADGMRNFDQPETIFARSLRQNDDVNLFNLTLDYDFDQARLTSITSYSRRDQREQSPNFFFDLTDPAEGTGTLYSDPSRNLTQEFRIRSTSDTRWDWIGGIWFSSLDIDAGQKRFDVTDATVCDLAELPPGCDVIYDVAFTTNIRELGLFGETTYRISDAWAVTAGARWFHTNDDQMQTALTDTVLQSGVIKYKGHDVDIDPKVAVEYRGIDNWLLYGRADRGHKPGFGTLIPPPGLCGVIPGAQEAVRRSTALSQEIGARYTAPNYQHRLAVAAYSIDWADIQLLGAAPCGFAYWFNTSRANSRGLELEYTGRISDDWSLDAALAYNQTELRAPTPFGGLPGDELPHSPDWLIHTGLQRELQGDNLDAFVRVDLTYVGSSVSSSPAFGVPLGEKEGNYTLLDLSFGLGLRRDLWLRAGVRNLTDVRAPVYISPGWFDVNIGEFNFVSLTQPRMIFATLTYEF
jgi:iron complex outermembrane recepter protein